MKAKKGKYLKIIIVAIILTPIFLFSLITLPFINKVFPNIYISNIYVGDKNKDEAIKILEEKFTLFDQITLKTNSQNFVLKTNEIVQSVDYTKSIDRAYNYTNSGNFVADIKNKILLIQKPVNFGVKINLDNAALAESVSIISQKTSKQPIYPSLKLVSGNIQYIKGVNGLIFDQTKLIDDIENKLVYGDTNELNIYLDEIHTELDNIQEKNFIERGNKLKNKTIELVIYPENAQKFSEKHILSSSTLISLLHPKNKFDTTKISNEIEIISKKFNKQPQDSLLVVENGIVEEFVPSKTGILVNKELLLDKIVETLISLEASEQMTASLTIPVTLTSPKVELSDINNLGIETLIGKGVSYYKGSIANRVFNINHATNKFKGVLVAPGETFSFNAVLGDVSALTGYKSAYVIKDGKTVLGDGGGVCQVSTTLFRAVLNAGLPIVERRPHSYRVGYYEQGFDPGLDATIYYPTTDFKFKNDTPAHILIQPINNPSASTLTFEIYGTDDGRVATITKPIITSSIAPAEDLYIDDPSLPLGKINQIEYKAWGARVVFDYKVTKNGETLIDQKFVSNYRPWQAVYLRGTGGVN